MLFLSFELDRFVFQKTTYFYQSVFLVDFHRIISTKTVHKMFKVVCSVFLGSVLIGYVLCVCMFLFMLFIFPSREERWQNLPSEYKLTISGT